MSTKKRDPVEVVTSSLPRKIANQIAIDIFNEKILPGQRIIEDRYASDFGTSRAPIREALYLLEIEGVIERIPRRGAFVKKYKNKEIKDLYEIRLSLELMAIDRVTSAIPKEKANEIDRIIEQMENADLESYAQLNSDFHIKLLALSESEVFINLYTRLGSPLMALQRLSFLRLESMETSIADHKMIWKAIQDKKIKMAKVLLEDHNMRALDRLSRLLESKHE